MPKTIFKFVLDMTDEQTVELPVGAVPLCVQVQHGAPCLWALVDSTAPKESKSIVIHGTGHSISETVGQYLGTFQLDNGYLVFHAFLKE